MSLVEAVRGFCAQYGWDKTYWIAYSGGLDSHVLLHACHSLRSQFPLKLRAIHIHHGLSANAEHWASHCARVCDDYEIDFTKHHIKVQPNVGDSLEALAREKRYRIFADSLGESEILLTAHQQDDQAETVLMQLFRGAGIKGLSAMPAMKTFASGFHGRPLLAFTRKELEAYALQHHLQWIHDESNDDNKFTRNYLRQHIFTSLKNRWPTVTETISRSAMHCAEAQALLDEFAADICTQVRGSHENTLSVSKLLQLSDERQKLLFRTWIYQLGYPLPDTKKITNLQHDVLTAAQDRMPCVSWNGVEVRRFRDDIYVMKALAEHDIQQSLEWNLQTPLMLPGIGMLHASFKTGHRLLIDVKKIDVRFRQGGEVANLPVRGRHSLKNLFQEWHVPTWKRDRIPLIYLEDKLISAVGYFIDEDYMAQQDEMGWDISLKGEG